jgi:hypothetical protein
VTAEIAILNKSAVALAADSAVTISTPTGPKIYDSVNKLFALVKRQPVGVMVYDSADLLGVPWETIIKAYRLKRQGKGFARLEEYAEDFTEYIETEMALVTPALRDNYIDQLAYRRFLCVRRRLDNSVEAALNEGKRVGQKLLRTLADGALDEEEALWAKQIDEPWASRIDVVSLMKSIEGRSTALIAEVFDKLPLTLAHKKRLHALVRNSLGRRVKRHPALRGPADPLSGIVIAGFGSNEYFPRMMAYNISGMLSGVLRVSIEANQEITVDNPAIIAPFAQREMVDAFVSGINPQYEAEIRGRWRALQSEYPQAVVDLLTKAAPVVDAASLRTLKGQLGSLVASSTRDLEQRLSDLKNEQVAPVLDSVEYLPKDELAAMAESLVNLTSLKRRVSMGEAQTVGGPVDVALISRGDGFVWIKRKHYFDPRLNPSWPAVHADY